MKNKTILVVIFSLLLIRQGFTENVTKYGTTAAKFLSIPVGARATAMGAAFVSVVDDATVTYWNPGALGMMKTPQVSLSHTEWFGGLSFDFGSVVFPLGLNGSMGTMGVSYTALSMPEEPITTIDDPEGEFSGNFDAGSYAIGISYGKALTERFAIGGTAKYIVENIYNSNATGMALDIGTTYRTPFKGIQLGVSITNFGQKMQMDGEDLIVQKDIDETIGGNNESINARLMTDQFDLPLMMRIGIAWEAFKTDFNRMTLVVDAMHPNDTQESISLGGEYAFLNETFFLRGGYKNLFLDKYDGSFTFGFGIKYNSDFTQLNLDYAFSKYHYLQDVHVFTLAFTL